MRLIDARVTFALEMRACQVPRSPAQKGYFNVRDAVAYLACPRSRIYDAVGLGALDPLRDGSRLLFTQEELDRYVESGGAKSPDPRKRSANGSRSAA